MNENDLRKNLGFVKVPQASIESIRSKLAFKIFDEYVNILKGMCSMRFKENLPTEELPQGLRQSHTDPYLPSSLTSRPRNLTK